MMPSWADSALMPVVVDEACLGHRASWSFQTGGSMYRVHDDYRRVERIRDALCASEEFVLAPSRSGCETLLAAMHPYHDFIRNAADAQPPGSDGLYPYLFPGEGACLDATRPHPQWLGRYCSDFYTPILSSTYAAALASARCAWTAAGLVAAGTPYAYALCRPSGHHAGPRTFGGYCYFNNAALAAERVSRLGSVAIVDIDYHHGNGTQEFFYCRKEVLFASIHGDPAYEYPYFWGYADETGHGDGAGTTLNIPLPAKSGEGTFLDGLDRILRAVSRFDPAYLVISVGYDGCTGDPLSGIRLGPAAYEEAGARLGAIGLPKVLCQEGGYDLDTLGELARRFLQAFRSHHVRASSSC